MIYLDTHVVLWLYADKGKRLSEQARQEIEAATSLLISPMVLLEMDYLHEIKRTTLPSGPVYDYLSSRIGLELCGRPFVDVVRLASQLWWTRDPFDRIITAQAGIENNGLITKDESIRDNYESAVW